jgi:hypothetical protein
MNGRTRLTLVSRQLLIRWAAPTAVACLAIAGCGGSTASSTAANSTATSSATESAGLSAFQTCLKEHGVKITPRASFSPRPFASGSSFPTAFPTAFPSGFGRTGGANSAAFKACQKYEPAGFGGRVISSSAIAAFKSCMSNNGVKVTGTTFAALAALSRSSKKAAAAFKICRVLLSQGLATPKPSSTS